MSKKVVVLVCREGLGSVPPEDRDFSREMLDKFLHALESQALKPEAICFYTEGVKLACIGSPVLFSLRLIEKMGVRLMICTSCLEYYGLKDKVAAGQVAGMNDIVQLMLEADTVIAV